MEEDRIRWNNKYQDRLEAGSPLAVLRDYMHLAKPGQALDLACGLGRHALFLAEQGLEVDAVDISKVALARINHPRIHTQLCDLDDYRITPTRYDLIVNSWYLNRDLWSGMAAGLKPGGVLIFQTALLENQHISNPDFKLRPGELLGAFPLKTHFHEEANGVGTLVAIKD